MKVVAGDITDVTEGIVCQQVNCQGVIGAGVSGAIIEKWPQVRDDFYDLYGQADSTELYGGVSVIKLADKLYAANIYSQYEYGNSARTGKVYTNMEYLLKHLKDLCELNPDTIVYAPYGIGCGLAGGDWSVVEQAMQETPNMVFVKKEG